MTLTSFLVTPTTPRRRPRNRPTSDEWCSGWRRPGSSLTRFHWGRASLWWVRDTGEPLNNGHIGMGHYREVVLFQRQNVLPIYSLVRTSAFILKCPLFRVSMVPLTRHMFYTSQGVCFLSASDENPSPAFRRIDIRMIPMDQVSKQCTQSSFRNYSLTKQDTQHTQV